MSYDRFAAKRRWLVRTDNPGYSTCSRYGVVTVDFHVRFDLADLSRDEISRRLQAAGTARYTQQLFLFSQAMQIGDEVVTRAGRRWFSGTITSVYRYAPHLVDEHPHVRKVDWARLPLAAKPAAAVAASARRQPFDTVQLLGIAEAPATPSLRAPVLLHFPSRMPARAELRSATM